jgi:predicted nuclease of predicted toxin-antitoxin system
MKILLDECLPRKLKKIFADHDVYTARQMKWDSIKNGKLLALAEKAFDVFCTADQNIVYQNVISRFNIAIVLIEAPSNRLESYLPLTQKILSAVAAAQKGKLVHVV